MFLIWMKFSLILKMRLEALKQNFRKYENAYMYKTCLVERISSYSLNHYINRYKQSYMR